nr:MAG TPA: hypothetical protein [Caudoviricetes sp.]
MKGFKYPLETNTRRRGEYFPCAVILKGEMI